ncbi:3-oxoacyl-[acyl-carrier protein] reductase [Amaricoccus macauensis]|uniref:3-oxoacyl-[acyl-carrier protein] reductase n=1 Tax=Amaricoccus macauensis TaxID=57001 RepID=A0A840ST31_9RHOB|nr:SDR family NAD(P)-dependent oxidoreductase [Amaricoccus macauensis]MBB5222483.1 3-oxoacyl-[acyl-carrier protein] reductase [Amaricoccus macauensis]
MPTAETSRVAIVTGGAGGLGLPIAARLADRGHRVAIWDLDGARAETAAAGIEGARGYAVDVTDPVAIDAACARVVDEMGPLGILVTSAGHNGPVAPFAEYPTDGWDFVMKLNLDAVFHCCQAAVREMLKTGYGRIVNIASIAGKEGNPNAVAYSASKAGVIGLTKSVGRELATTGVLVNCVAPAAIETEMLTQVTPEFRAYVTSKIPLGRLGRAEEVASLVAWLASEECSFSTGAVFDASGGRATY